MDFDLGTRIGHACDLGHCSYDSDSPLLKPLNTIEYDGLYIMINIMFSRVCCAIFHMHYFTFSHKKNTYETVSNSVHIIECTIPVLNIYIYSILHFKYKIEIKISNNTHQNILIYKSSEINYVAMIIYVQCPDLKYCYLRQTSTQNTGNLINSTSIIGTHILKRAPYTTLHPNHDVRQVCEIIVYYTNSLGNSIIPPYILLCVCLAYKCLLCMCGPQCG